LLLHMSYYLQHIQTSVPVSCQYQSYIRLLFKRDHCSSHQTPHSYIKNSSEIGLKEAIQTTQEGVKKMKNEWSSTNCLNKFERIIFLYTVRHLKC
jgi:hypothetical protein